jgi:hypothetical protein
MFAAEVMMGFGGIPLGRTTGWAGRRPPVLPLGAVPVAARPDAALAGFVAARCAFFLFMASPVALPPGGITEAMNGGLTGRRCYWNLLLQPLKSSTGQRRDSSTAG